MRRLAPPACSWSRRKAMRFAALSVTVMARSPASLDISVMFCGSLRPAGIAPRVSAVYVISDGGSYHPAHANGRGDARRSAGAAPRVGAQGAVAVDVDDPQRQS